ncbi:MAG: helix-turn-helix domain-containing protein [Propionicimonas sp.]|uniref:helix-turn-helix domain-containing protein n=1 Tax=Propionicimonas sp. TaxID=1955623 RepID=UPI003D0C6370
MTSPLAPLGTAIRARREGSGMTQEQLAARAGMGTSSLRKFEAGRASGVSVITVLRLLNVFDMPITSLEPLARQLASDDDAGPPTPHGRARPRTSPTGTAS